jgi:hypothetical protein
VRGPIADADGVTVGRGAHSAADTNGARRAGHVFDDDGLAERSAHRVAQGAGEGIDRTAGAEWDDQGDRVRRIWLRQRGARPGQSRNGQAERESSHISLHVIDRTDRRKQR